MTSEADVVELVEKTISEFGKVDILINNAGINIRGPIEDLSEDEFSEVMRINVNGPWLLCRAVAPHMKKAGYGRVINMSSTLGAVGVPNRTPYASSKGAVTMMTRVLALEWGELGVTVNAVAPTFIYTPGTAERLDDPEYLAAVVDRIPLGHVGQISDVAGAVIYLASDAGGLVNGAILPVDGGWTAQ